MSNHDEFARWFRQATGNEPYPFQIRFACEPELPELVDVPTGLGKTAMAVLGWLWRRRFAEETVRKATPRRLVYCLPMRVLVEQTKGETSKWIAEIQKRYPTEMVQPLKVHVLMGGEDEEDWDIYPECDQIIIGTQDMLLSRALNRGYAATRSRWPVKFGLLNTDCLWVFDEIQLMGAGLSTTTQLDAFRRVLPAKDSDNAKNGHGCRSVWMSATLHRDWLNTVDFKEHADSLSQLALNQDDHRTGEVKKRWTAKKPLKKTEAVMGDISVLAKEVRKAHKPGKRTIVILNTVKRACELCKVLDADAKSKPHATEPAIVLLHSRFRPEDRKRQVERALAAIEPDQPGIIVVSTQVIEAGVDLSATTLFTEPAPWASLVQRFGRCNRRGRQTLMPQFIELSCQRRVRLRKIWLPLMI
ncbi:MAG: CRISPR-associated helicase Cas3' [Nitrospiraceae bacterium]